MSIREFVFPDGKPQPIVTVLVVDDDSVNRMLLLHLLVRHGFSACEARHGSEALDMLAQRAIDVILMDVAMPVMDGNEATRRIRTAEVGTHRHIPIIGISAHAAEADRRASLESGMDAYLPKPIDTTKLFDALAVCGRRRSLTVATASSANAECKPMYCL